MFREERVSTLRRNPGVVGSNPIGATFYFFFERLVIIRDAIEVMRNRVVKIVKCTRIDITNSL